MPPNLHSVIGPSSADRWLHCAGSVRLAEKFRERFGDRSSPFAEEGTQAHALAELKLRREIGEINDFSFKEMRKALEVEKPDLNWKKIDWATDIYVDAVMTAYYEAKAQCPDTILVIEQRYDMSRWAKGCFGTGDATIVSDVVLHVFDYKNGSGVPVTAIENPQARLYGLGAINEYGDLYGFKTVRNTIVQPNLDSITTEELTREQLLEWGDSIREPARKAWEGVQEYDAGSWCRFCAARALCYHRAAKAMTVFQSGMQTPGVIPDEEIPKILECADVAEAWIKDIREYARSQALKGQTWNGFKLVAGRRPPRRWTDHEAVVDQLSRAGYTDDQIYKPKELISVSDAEKLVGKQGFRAILGQFCTQPEGAPALVPESDKRLSLNSSEAAFADLIET